MKYGTSCGRRRPSSTGPALLPLPSRTSAELQSQPLASDPAPGLRSGPGPAQARSRQASPSWPRHARKWRWRILSCSWWRGASAVSPTSPSRACCLGNGRREGLTGPRGQGCRGAVGSVWVRPAVTRPILACQGHLAHPEGPRLLPRLDQPLGESPEKDPRRQDRLHRGQVERRASAGSPDPPRGCAHPPRGRGVEGSLLWRGFWREGEGDLPDAPNEVLRTDPLPYPDLTSQVGQ